MGFRVVSCGFEGFLRVSEGFMKVSEGFQRFCEGFSRVSEGFLKVSYGFSCLPRTHSRRVIVALCSKEWRRAYSDKALWTTGRQEISISRAFFLSVEIANDSGFNIACPRSRVSGCRMNYDVPSKRSHNRKRREWDVLPGYRDL